MQVFIKVNFRFCTKFNLAQVKSYYVYIIFGIELVFAAASMNLPMNVMKYTQRATPLSPSHGKDQSSGSDRVNREVGIYILIFLFRGEGTYVVSFTYLRVLMASLAIGLLMAACSAMQIALNLHSSSSTAMYVSAISTTSILKITYYSMINTYIRNIKKTCSQLI